MHHDPTAPDADVSDVAPETRLELLRLMLLQRAAEDRIVIMYRQGRISGSVYTGRGQEAVAAAVGLALQQTDVCAPLNREMACHLARGVPLSSIFAHFLGKVTGPTGGRDGNMHFGFPERGVFPLVSMLGDLVPVTVGAALAFKRRAEHRVALTFLGDGAFSTGDVHEGFNLAAVWKVPAVFVVQNNRFAYSTPTENQMVNTNIAERLAGGWSIPCERVDGTDALLVFQAARTAIERARAGHGPQAIEALSLRGHGHAAHDGATYVPDALRAQFGDPIERLIGRLTADGVRPAAVENVRQRATNEVALALEEAEGAPAPDPENLLLGVYADVDPQH